MKLKVKLTMRDLFTRLNQTIIYVTHDQTEAMTLADEIALMNDGAIDQMAPPRELYNDSASRFSGWFLGNPGMDFITVDGNRELVQAIVGGSLSDSVATVGFRPEFVKVANADGSAGVLATVKHSAIATGGQMLVNLQSGDVAVKAKLPWDTTLDVSPGTTVRWSVPSERLNLFDAGDTAVVASADA